MICLCVYLCVREREFGSATILTSHGEVGHSDISGSLMALLFDDGERGKTYVDKDGLGVVNDDGIGGHVCRILCLFHFHLRQIKGCQCWSYLDGRRKIDLDLEF